MLVPSAGFVQCSTNNFRKKTSTSELVERTDAIYANQLKYIDADPEDAAVYGIKYKCIFSKLDYFSVPNAFPPDNNA